VGQRVHSLTKGIWRSRPIGLVPTAKAFSKHGFVFVKIIAAFLSTVYTCSAMFSWVFQTKVSGCGQVTFLLPSPTHHLSSSMTPTPCSLGDECFDAFQRSNDSAKITKFRSCCWMLSIKDSVRRISSHDSAELYRKTTFLNEILSPARKISQWLRSI